MNAFNRIVVVVLLLILIPVMTAAFVLPHVVLPGIGDWLRQWGYFFGSGVSPWIRFIAGALLAAIFDIAAILLLVLELRPRRKRYIRVQSVAGGMATIGSESIIRQLQYALDSMPGVLKVSPNIKAKKDQVQAVIDVEVAADVSVPETAQQLMHIAQEVLTEELGLEVYGEPEVRIKVTKKPSGRSRRPRSAPPAPPQPAPPVKPTAPATEGPPPLPSQAGEPPSEA